MKRVDELGQVVSGGLIRLRRCGVVTYDVSTMGDKRGIRASPSLSGGNTGFTGVRRVRGGVSRVVSGFISGGRVVVGRVSDVRSRILCSVLFSECVRGGAFRGVTSSVRCSFHRALHLRKGTLRTFRGGCKRLCLGMGVS